LPLAYVLRRIALFFAVLLVAATLNFFLPRIGGQDPIAQRLYEQTLSGASMQAGFQELVDTYNRKFGLDRPLWQQYLYFLADTARLDFRQSIANYPRPVTAVIADALPWTIGLLGTTTLLSFAIGSLLGALVGWGRSPRAMRALLPFFFVFSAVPFYLLGLILLHFVAFQNPIFPLFGAYRPGMMPGWRLDFVLDVVKHATLPALSIVLAGIGYWALGMRGMMVTTQGEDYMLMAEAKGLRPRRIFLAYAVRNALLPQTTALALSLGHITSGAVLIEVVFGYPGMGTLLLHSIQAFDYFVIQGIVFTLILGIAFAMLLIDLLLPLLDPRIAVGRA
jgi:peptide/nickel transport system permease protein